MVINRIFIPSDGRISISGLEALIEEEKATGKLPGDNTKDEVLRLASLREVVEEFNAKYGPGGYQ